MKRIIAVVCLLFFLSTAAYAHGGRTDGNGGHTDSSTGEYHYHHGYPAHDHYDMDDDGDVDCPYDFDDKTGQNSGASSSTRSFNDILASYGLPTLPPSTAKPLPSPTPGPEPIIVIYKEDLKNIVTVVACVGFVLSISIPLIYRLRKKHGSRDNEDAGD